MRVARHRARLVFALRVHWVVVVVVCRWFHFSRSLTSMFRWIAVASLDVVRFVIHAGNRILVINIRRVFFFVFFFLFVESIDMRLFFFYQEE